VAGLVTTPKTQKMGRAEQMDNRLGAMAFYNPNGFVPAFNHAKAFAGDGGHVGTMLDVVDARLATEPSMAPWQQYYTTMSAEYVGISRSGEAIVIVAHGIGPMATLDGVLKAYSFQFKDKSRNRHGGRITKNEFLRLESGYYGDVTIIPLAEIWARRPYQFSGHPITRVELGNEPLWQARLGPRWKELCRKQEAMADKWSMNEGKEPYFLPCVISMDCTTNCSYASSRMFIHHLSQAPDTAIGHLLSTGSLGVNHHQYWGQDYENDMEFRSSLTLDVNCHDWCDGTRMIGVRAEQVEDIHPGLPDHNDLVKRHLKKLLIQNPGGTTNTRIGFHHLIQVGDRLFSDYPKKGDSMDSHEPKFLVTSAMELPGGPKILTTEITGYYGLFTYPVSEVRRMAPPDANAYMIDNPNFELVDEGSPKNHTAEVTFFRVEIDTSMRVMKRAEVYRDFDLMMALVD